MVNFGELFGDVGLEAILSMPNEEFAGYKDEIQKSIQETLISEEFQAEIREHIMATGHNNYILIQELQDSIESIREGLGTVSEEKRSFVMDIYMGIVNASLKIAQNEMFKHMPIHITKLRPTAKLPTYAHSTDAAADVYAAETTVIEPHSKKAIPTGLAVAVPHGYQMNAYLRSGTSLKTPLMLANGVGVCDAGYRGEMFILVANISNEPYTVEAGERIAQFQLAPVIQMDWVEVDSVEGIGEDRGGGLGSTGQ